MSTHYKNTISKGYPKRNKKSPQLFKIAFEPSPNFMQFHFLKATVDIDK